MRTLRNTLAVGTAVVALVAPAAVAVADPAGAPTTPVDQLLLADGEFPAGYEVMPFSVADRLEMIAPLNQFQSKVTVTPAECAPKVSALQQHASDLPMVSAFSDRTTTGLVEVLSAKPAAVNAAALQNCSNVKVELQPSEQVPAKALINIKISQVSVAGVPAGTTVIATQGTGTVTINGKDGKPGKERAVNVNQIEGVNQVRGYTVVVTASGSQGGRLDRAGFAQTLTKAVDKVRTAK
ncbi:hypothetical protein [Tsukamurella pseudospumae]|uniref:DUF5642 domain-containing protein n=1 Tax=Tsukamurella pseudospumae TaxID=239498 RepID=A0A138A3J5_9ACTN|nr:hypothetical protein [Tsukamurella pseudospumae]KXO98690.1 hypothetical protein AXK61_03685 [Tsukamurella pseudospumae]KXP05011.1 hypothetical protein AXK60_12635 [Tsukamurella pseudospumae]